MRKQISGIDVGRVVAAILVVMIHTSPFESISPALDFAMTHGLARVAVPFFFMVSGYFLFRDCKPDTAKLKRFVKRTAIVYGIAMALYLPVNLYNGFFTRESRLLSVLQALLLDGTMYHLWYLPASMLGAVIVWALLRYAQRIALGVTSALYLLGLMGDSYYGLTQTIPVLAQAYEGYFQFALYTRNGLFFAPLFMLMGARMHQPHKSHGLLGALALAGMIAETVWLKSVGWPRHDSMTLLLPICMALLFPVVLHKGGKPSPFLRDLSLAVYIVHPLMIVLLRGLAKALGAFEWMIPNSLLYFTGVMMLSFLAGLLYAKGRPSKAKAEEAKADRCWIEINRQKLQGNVAALQAQLPVGCQLMAVVKDNAYGHGAVAVSRELSKLDVRAFAVATLEEGVELRQNGIQGEILVLGYTDPVYAPDIKRYDLIQTLVSLEHALAFEAGGIPIRAHVAVDTGMHRLGIDVDKQADIQRCYQLKHVHVEGMFSHLCDADGQDPDAIAFTKKQAAAFASLCKTLENPGKTHLQNSHGLLNYPDIHCDYARIGIALYGAVADNPALSPVLSLKARVALIRRIKAGEPVGYGRAFTAKRDMTLAVVPIGYGDGLPRCLSLGRGRVLMGGHPAPIIGQICMDQMMVDITDIPNVGVGSLVTLIGENGLRTQTAMELAQASGSIVNELLSRLGMRPPRKWI